MSERSKSFGGALQRAYNAILQRPLPWRMIDALVTLEEACERQGALRQAGRTGELPDQGASETGTREPGAISSDPGAEEARAE